MMKIDRMVREDKTYALFGSSLMILLLTVALSFAGLNRSAKSISGFRGLGFGYLGAVKVASLAGAVEEAPAG